MTKETQKMMRVIGRKMWAVINGYNSACGHDGPLQDAASKHVDLITLIGDELQKRDAKIAELLDNRPG
jgi:hypothetical protein